jgi:prevent-host-death family protein
VPVAQHKRRALPGRSITSSSTAEAVIGQPPGKGKTTKSQIGRRYTVKATEAKNRFGVILKKVGNAEPVFIEKHGSQYAVVLDIDSYEDLLHKAREPHEIQLDSLRQEFDALYANMQTAKSRGAARLLSDATAEQLNEVAASRAKARG